MSDERKDKELKDEELDKVSGGVHSEMVPGQGHHRVESGVNKDWSGEGGKHHIESGTHNTK